MNYSFLTAFQPFPAVNYFFMAIIYFFMAMVQIRPGASGSLMSNVSIGENRKKKDLLHLAFSKADLRRITSPNGVWERGE
jgi:hypothetical protein